jgi:hypothetical protein
MRLCLPRICNRRARISSQHGVDLYNRYSVYGLRKDLTWTSLDVYGFTMSDQHIPLLNMLYASANISVLRKTIIGLDTEYLPRVSREPPGVCEVPGQHWWVTARLSFRSYFLCPRYLLANASYKKFPCILGSWSLIQRPGASTSDTKVPSQPEGKLWKALSKPKLNRTSYATLGNHGN